MLTKNNYHRALHIIFMFLPKKCHYYCCFYLLNFLNSMCIKVLFGNDSWYYTMFKKKATDFLRFKQKKSIIIQILIIYLQMRFKLVQILNNSIIVFLHELLHVGIDELWLILLNPVRCSTDHLNAAVSTELNIFKLL